MKKTVFSLLIFLVIAALYGADLTVLPDDIRIEADPVSGLHVYIRKKDGMKSILLTETTKDPAGIENNYALRSESWNPINGDELRILNGQFLLSDYSVFSITDSSVQQDEQFGEAFHLFLPQTMQYGYPWSRIGKVELQKGLFINIRTFELPFADYAGTFADNPFLLDISLVNEKKVTELLDNFNQKTVESFSALADSTKGQVAFSKNPDDLLQKIKSLLLPPDPNKVIDLVFAIDATESMKDDIDKLRKEMVPAALSVLSEYKAFRVGLLLYKDYEDDFSHKGLPIKLFQFTEDLSIFNQNLYAFKVFGGRDYPEAVYEALYGSMEFFSWNPEAERRIILIGDAEPHQTPRGSGKYGKELVETMAYDKKIQIDAIILFDAKRR